MRTLELAYVTDSCVEFKGYGTRELHVEIAGRPPVWNTRTRRWVTSPRRAGDLMALATTKGYAVRVLGDERRRGTPPPTIDQPTPVDINDAALW